ncbi:hypothetical protein H4582DRAFT_2068235 [Lactarius indigo]|nr:hypothetical protein H4582DRAFT_2068235 [Lactarius indigo]
MNLWFLPPYPGHLKRWHGFPPVEEHQYSVMVGGPTLVIGILLLGWSGNYESVPWWVPGLSTILIDLSITLIFTSFADYLFLLGGVALILAPIPFLFYNYGQRIHTKSYFAPCVDLKVAKFLEEDELTNTNTVVFSSAAYPIL